MCRYTTIDSLSYEEDLIDDGPFSHSDMGLRVDFEAGNARGRRPLRTHDPNYKPATRPCLSVLRFGRLMLYTI